MRGEPIMLQLCVVPAYALTIHKARFSLPDFCPDSPWVRLPRKVLQTQALSIKHRVIGVLEGVFAIGQVYVLVSRVTDPENFVLCGLPPKDLWEDVTDAWRRAGLNVADCWKRACAVTNEWVYDHQPEKPLKSRIQQRHITEKGIPLKNRTLAETLDPQPEASAVFKRLLDVGGGAL